MFCCQLVLLGTRRFLNLRMRCLVSLRQDTLLVRWNALRALVECKPGESPGGFSKSIRKACRPSFEPKLCLPFVCSALLLSTTSMYTGEHVKRLASTAKRYAETKCAETALCVTSCLLQPKLMLLCFLFSKAKSRCPTPEVDTAFGRTGRTDSRQQQAGPDTKSQHLLLSNCSDLPKNLARYKAWLGEQSHGATNPSLDLHNMQHTAHGDPGVCSSRGQRPHAKDSPVWCWCCRTWQCEARACYT